MINKKLIKKIALNKGKKIGLSAISKIEKILQTELEKLVMRASRQADFSGRKVIKAEDIIEKEDSKDYFV
ncbi:MAG: hypothetical protein Q8P57_01070 [Candidatus Pacearchaeota archaeon]|nr:hypothetical protein [Candidatus Pacearchaeota archaeon]